ncbi:hypothetical protein [Xanthocytophaga agilis]|uniref:Uncharacterized protein n=1 Tax=Xanthocytophaga agilis TaxID=3048010 RepID=A0AAE3UCC4_9BACT|nr:hypothetical protein [Xanthocytophaga agilis]MDJ1499201.1 hypothetical protein [Xanthocytophaga agilis]
MKKLLEEIDKIEFTIEPNYSFDLDKEFDLISMYLNLRDRECLKYDFDIFLGKGRFIVHNSLGGNLLFLKVPERIEKIRIGSNSNSCDFEVSVIFESDNRRKENTKYKPNAGKIDSTTWNVLWIFPNFFKYEKVIQCALMLVIGKIIKQICEYGRTSFAYMKIENDFAIELLIDGELEFKLKIKSSS